jgi:hypothetical protein
MPPFLAPLVAFLVVVSFFYFVVQLVRHGVSVWVELSNRQLQVQGQILQEMMELNEKLDSLMVLEQSRSKVQLIDVNKEKQH